MNQVAIHLNQHSKSTIVQSKIKVKQNKESKREKERRKINKETATTLPSGLGHLGWNHIPGAGAALRPTAGLRQRQAGEDVSAKEPPPWTCSAWAPVEETPVSKSRWALLQFRQVQHLKDGGPLVWKSSEKSRGRQASQWGGSHQHPPSSEVLFLSRTASSALQFCQSLRFAWEAQGKGGKVMIHKPWHLTL